MEKKEEKEVDVHADVAPGKQCYAGTIIDSFNLNDLFNTAWSSAGFTGKIFTSLYGICLLALAVEIYSSGICQIMPADFSFSVFLRVGSTC